ncbi:MAG: hypothetical protein F2861_06770, partial [Actinobacteria bacterium]|nr:hypothetical protein [Actinomycetota bacterium]
MIPIITDQRWGRAMGTDVHVIVVAPSDQSKVLLDLAERRIAELESRWSRFIATSEISRLGS